MASIKVHVYRGADTGAESCDYRGDRFVGSLQDPRNVRQVADAHRTIPWLEIDPASEEQIEKVLQVGPAINASLAELIDIMPSFAAPLASTLGLEGSGPPALRIGVWDE